LKFESPEVVTVGPGDTDSFIDSTVGVVIFIGEITWSEFEMKVIDVDGETALLIILERVEGREAAEFSAAIGVVDATGSGIEIDVLGLSPGGSERSDGDG